MTAFQPTDTPIEEGLKLSVEPKQISIDKRRYQRLVERLMHLDHTIPEIAYSLIVESHFVHNLGQQHINGIMRILKYLKSFTTKETLFTKYIDPQGINIYTDGDWA